MSATPQTIDSATARAALPAPIVAYSASADSSELNCFVRVTTELGPDGYPYVDLAREVADFEGYKRALNSWDGVVRFDHTREEIGHLVRLYFDAASRAIYAWFKITNAFAIRSVKRGKLTGVSHKGPILPGGLVPESFVGADGVVVTFNRLMAWVCDELSLVFDPVNAYSVVISYKGASGAYAPGTDEEMMAMVNAAAAAEKDAQKNAPPPVVMPPATTTAKDVHAQRAAYLATALESMKAAIALGIEDTSGEEIQSLENLLSCVRQCDWAKYLETSASAEAAIAAATETVSTATAVETQTMKGAGEPAASAIPEEMAQLAATLAASVESVKGLGTEIPALVETVKSLAGRVETLSGELTTARAKITELEKAPAITMPPRGEETTTKGLIPDPEQPPPSPTAAEAEAQRLFDRKIRETYGRANRQS